MEHRVVITGLGVISPNGIGKEIFWDALITGKIGYGKITLFDTTGYKINIGAEVKESDYHKYLGEEEVNNLSRQAQFSLAATRMALEDSRFNIDNFDSDRIGVIIGMLSSDVVQVQKMIFAWKKDGVKDIPSDYMNKNPWLGISQIISSKIGLGGPSVNIFCACSSGNYCVAHGYDMIKAGSADAMIVGGVDIFNRMIFTGFHNWRALATEICQPFDKNRKGLVVGEGAGILILQSLESAIRNNNRIHAEILGYGLSCDAYHLSAPHPEGDGAVLAMNRALENSQKNPQDIQYISAHGTGTYHNDRMETLAIKKVFGDYAYKLSISSIKSMIGHTMGAASALESIVCALVIENQIVPPTIHYNDFDPECDLDYVPNKTIEKKVEITMNNSFGFGGNNASVIIGKYYE